MKCGAADQRLLFPATQRNRIPIGDALERHLPSQGLVLELASGSGEHGVTFQQRFPALTWQCSDPDPEHCRCRLVVRSQTQRSPAPSCSITFRRIGSDSPLSMPWAWWASSCEAVSTVVDMVCAQSGFSLGVLG